MDASDLDSLVHSRPARWAGAAAIAGALTALWVRSRARRAVREQPPAGRLLHVDGVRLHVVEQGSGPPVVLIHGNAVTHRDFVASGLVERLARTHRVIAFDRPGFGHSSRPRDRLWTPSAQAELLHRALGKLGVGPAVVVGHSLGAMVAVALALEHRDDVRRLVVIGGYYYPTLRVDALLTAPVALPLLGDALRYTVTAVSARLTLDAMVRTMFAPEPVPPDYLPTLSREMLVRPLQLRASAEDAVFMMPQARANGGRYGALMMPVAIVAGAEDAVVDVGAHAARLHDELPGSTLTIVEGAGHMAHHAAPDEIVALVERFALPRVGPSAPSDNAAAGVPAAELAPAG